MELKSTKTDHTYPTPRPKPLQVVVGNRKTSFRGTVEALSLLREKFRFRPPGYYFSPRYQSGAWDGYIYLYRYGKVSTGLYLDLREELRREFSLHEDDQRVAPQFRELPPSLKAQLRGYQEDCIEAMIAHSKTGGLVINCTGSGKTFIAGGFFARLRGRGCFINDELTLLEQSRRALSSILGEEEVGEVGHGVFSPRRVTVATIQTLHRQRNNPKFQKWFDSLDCVIVDELHVALNRQNSEVLEQIQPKTVYGLTATLELEKPHIRMRAVALAGPPIFSYPLKQGVEDAVISQGVFLQVRFPQHSVSRNYATEYRELISHSGPRNQCVESLVREGIRRGRRVIVLVERISHLRTLSQQMRDIPHQIVCGAYSKESRLAAKLAMDEGKLPLILANRVFAKGVDIRTVDTIIDATGGRSSNSVIQRYGRGSRIAPEKIGLIYFDIGDCSFVGDRNRFSANSHARLNAIKKLEVPVLSERWTGNTAQSLYDKALQRLLQERRS